MHAPYVGYDGSRVEALEQLALEAGAEPLAARARDLGERVRDGLFYVACIGQFKRGKSTLLNAFLGEPLLPAGVVPVTSVITIIRYGPNPAARVRFSDGGRKDVPASDLASFVTEEQNPGNRKGVAAVEVFIHSELLASGMCLVDTPGIGSVFLNNTETTRDFVPHVDAALVVLGADPPISADELALIAQLARRCDHMLFILNKSDKLSDAELAEAGRFTLRVLAKQAELDNARLFSVSAIERLAGRGATRDWARLTEALRSLAHDSGSGLLRAAEEKGLALLSRRLGRHLDEQRDALLRPVEESQRRSESLRACVIEAVQSLNDLGYLLTGEQERLSRVFHGRKQDFLDRAIPRARQEFSTAIRLVDARSGRSLWSKAISLAQEISKRWLDQWLAESQPVAEAVYVEATRRFVELANSFLQRLAVSGDPALAALPSTLPAEAGFRVRSRLYYTWLLTHTRQPLMSWFLDLIRTREKRAETLDRQVGDYIEELIYVNANRIANDFDDRVLESRRRLQSEIRSVLEETVASVQRAFAKASELQSQGSRAVKQELHRIDSINRRLIELGLERGDIAS